MSSSIERLYPAMWVAAAGALAIIFAGDPVCAQEAESVPSEVASAQSKAPPPDDAISNALRLALKFRDHPELNGDYRVDSDDVISVPVLGRISVSGLTAADLEKALIDRARQSAGAQVFPTVEIAEYRPVFVTGYVNRSGASPWQPGMTVLQAVALAGGLYRAAPTSGDMPDTIRLRRAVEDQKRNLAMFARLHTEQSGAKTITTPRELVDLVGQKEAGDLIKAQSTLLAARRLAFADQVAANERGRSLARQELEALKVQNAKLSKQTTARRENTQRIRELKERGLVVNDRSFEQEMKVLELEEKMTNIAVAIARIEASLASMERELLLLQQTHSAEIAKELARLDRDIAQGKLEIEAAGGEAKRPPKPPDANIVVRYRIKRLQAQTLAAIDAGEGTLLRPGDVLDVRIGSSIQQATN